MTHDTKHTSSAAPVLEGERVHHHIHENVQPVIHKETITPEVVHTTVPIHETHHASAQHHGTSVLPMKELKDIHSTGGILSDGQTRTDQYEGCPKPYNDKMKIDRTEADQDVHSHTKNLGTAGFGSGQGTSTNAGPHSSNVGNAVDPRVDSDRDGSRTVAGAGAGGVGGVGSTTSKAVEGHPRSHTGHGMGTTGAATGASGLSGAGSGGLGHGGHDTMGSTTSHTSGATGVRKPEIGTDSFATGNIDPQSQPNPNDRHRKTIGVSGMDDFTQNR